jgi:hypothetical protein
MHRPKRRARGAVLAIFVALVSTAQADPAPDEKTAVVREIIRVTGAEQIGAQMSATLIGQLKQSFPTVPDEIWTEFLASMDPAEATELMIPVYSKHFTIGELRELLAFYSTPLGRKLIAEMPAVMQESTLIGSEWGRRKMEDIVRRLGEKGFQPAEI